MGKQQAALKDQGHTIPDITRKAFEMQLRKIATQGVVRLFNTVHDFQKETEDSMTSLQMSKVPVQKRVKRLEQASKDTFEQLWAREKKPKGKRSGGQRAPAPAAAGLNPLD